MRIIVNDSRIKLRTKIGERAPFVGLIVLVASTIIVFAKPEWMGLSMIVVWIGLLISLTGSYLGDRYVGPFAHHRKVPEALKGLPDDNVLFVYKLPTPFVLLEPGGVTVLTVKSHAGSVSFSGKGWKHQQKMGFLRRFAGQEALGRPDKLANGEVESLQVLLNKHLPEGMQVPVRGIILFTHPEVRLEVENPPVPALRSPELKRWLRRHVLHPKLSEEVRLAVLGVFGVSDNDEDGDK